MAGHFKLDTDVIRGIATSIETTNKELQDELNNAKATISSLSSTWTGEAATQTITAFDEFAAKYFQSYYDIIDQYVKLLRTNVADGGDAVEKANVSLAEKYGVK